MKNAIFRARWLLLPDFSLLDNGALACENGRIVAVETFPALRRRYDHPVKDFEDAVILPGLINAHCHLEFTLPRDTIKPTSNFIAWLKQIVALKRATPPSLDSEHAAEGIAENLRNGTTTIVDIATTDAPIPLLRRSSLRKAIFFEAIDMQPESAETTLRILGEQYEALREDALLVKGIAPHAPYSVSEPLWRALVAWRRKNGARMATHVAETQEEIRMIRDGAGALYEHAREIALLPPGWRAPGVTPVRYLYDLGALDEKSLLIHCNYLTEEDIRLIAAARSSVIYCPGSHRFFSHPRHPLPELLAAGVNVCLGTDSRASNESLDMIREMRLVKEDFPEISWETILHLATRNAAQALGLHNRIGQLSPGYECDLTVLNVPEGMRLWRQGHSEPLPMVRQGSEESLLREVLAAAPPTRRATVVAGEILFTAS
jgi:cytosine/adenosine deaminase-related metal-dependent hydrolase